MKVSHVLRERWHPLHTLRKSSLFRTISRHVDPLIPWRLPLLPHRIYLRLLSNISIMLDSTAQESSVRETFTTLLSEMPRDGVFWDVGANIGCFSWHCATCRPDFEIVSFEPDLRNVQCLRRTSEHWALPRHTIISRAVAEKSGCETFFVDDVTGTTGSLVATSSTFNELHYGHKPHRIDVETVSLDDLVSTGARPPCIIKIDVEGAELRVIGGARQLLNREHPILFFEAFEGRSEIVDLLASLGYAVYDSDRRQKPVAETVNFLAVPNCSRRFFDCLEKIGYPTLIHVCTT